ncbi:MAG: cupredoxin domain-containing protein [Limisphaerales bacterium]
MTLGFAVSGCGGSGYGNGSSPSGGISGVTTFNVSAANAPTSYTINTQDNPPITVQRGITYTFNLNTSGHPFYIMSVQGTNTANAYTNGVTGNGGTSGTLTFVVPAGAPNTLYYDCSIHSGMTGIITVTN